MAAAWDGMNGVNMIDDSSLTLGAVPAADDNTLDEKKGITTKK